MEILKKLYLFPERLRCMFLHLWCLGLRASEVYIERKCLLSAGRGLLDSGVSGQNEEL